MVAFGRDVLTNLDAMIIAEYMWNADRYDADQAVARVLAHVAGRETVPYLLDYRHYYLRIATKFPIEKSLPDPDAKAQARRVLTEKERKRYCLTPKEYSLVQKDLAGLQAALGGIARTTGNEALIKRLREEYGRADRMLAYLRDSATEAASFVPSGTVELDIDTFRGGTGFRVYEWKCPPQYAVWVYGRKTPFSSMRTSFRLTARSEGPAELIIQGQDDDKADVTQIEILVNDKSIFRGPNGFAKKGWSAKRFRLAPATLRAGENVITIRNLEDSSAFAGRWFMLSGCAIRFTDRRDGAR